MQLIRITNHPIKYKFEIEPARLEMKQAQNPEGETVREPSRLQIRTKNIAVRLDTTELRASLNLRNSGAFARHQASLGAQAAEQATGEAVQFGNQMQQIQDGVSIAQIVQQKLLQQPETYTMFLPEVGPNISWDPNSVSAQYEAGSIKFDWQIMKNLMDYVPGKFRMQILEYPKVSIEYLGEPNYVPPSANPDFEETE